MIDQAIEQAAIACRMANDAADAAKANIFVTHKLVINGERVQHPIFIFYRVVGASKYRLGSTQLIGSVASKMRRYIRTESQLNAGSAK